MLRNNVRRIKKREREPCRNTPLPSPRSLTEPSDYDASANSVSRERPTSADKRLEAGPARINSWRPNCVAIRTNRYPWRPRRVVPLPGESLHQLGNSILRGSLFSFSFFFQSALSAACQPYRRGWDEVARERGRAEKRPIARNRRVSRERNAGKRAQRDTRRISRKKVNKPGPGFLSSFRGEPSGGGSNRGEAASRLQVSSRRRWMAWRDSARLCETIAGEIWGPRADPPFSPPPLSPPSVFRPITFLPSLYIPSVSRPRGRDV